MDLLVIPAKAGIHRTYHGLLSDTGQLTLFREAMQKVKIEDDPAVLMSKVSLAKNDLLSPADLEGSSKQEDKKIAKVYSCYKLLKRR